jgi:hypothetical protein
MMTMTVPRWLRRDRRERRATLLLRNAQWAAEARGTPNLWIEWLCDRPHDRPSSAD